MPINGPSYARFVGNEVIGNGIGSIGSGVVRGDFKNNKANRNRVALIGPTNLETLRILLESKNSLPDPPAESGRMECSA